MPEDNRPKGSQEDPEGNPPADTEQQQQQDPPQDPPAGDPDATDNPPADDPDADLDNNDELPEWARKELKKARAEAAARRVENKTLAEKLAAAVTPEDHMKIVEELRQENAKLTRQQTISSLVEELELPAKASALIKGDTPEELREAAEALAAILPKRDPDLPPPLDPQGGRQPGRPPAADPKELAKIAAKRRSRF